MKIYFAAVAALVLGGSAHAVTFTSLAGAPDPGPSMGETLVVDFNAGLAPGYSLTGDFGYVTGTSGAAAAPAGDLTRYFYVSSALPTNTATLDTPDLTSLSFYWGSIDTYNSVDLLDQMGNVLFTLSGGMLPPANGDQGAGISNRRVFFTAGAGEVISGIRFTSTGVAFELDDIAATAVPEPATWAMLIAGFGMVGFAARRRRSTFANTAA